MNQILLLPGKSPFDQISDKLNCIRVFLENVKNCIA